MRESVAPRVPILCIGDTLIATVQGSPADEVALGLQEDLSEAILKSRARGVVIDLSTVDVVDSFIGRVLSDIAATSRLLGARVVVAGIQPAVAITLVELGLTLPKIETALSTEAALAQLKKPPPPLPGSDHGG